MVSRPHSTWGASGEQAATESLLPNFDENLPKSWEPQNRDSFLEMVMAELFPGETRTARCFIIHDAGWVTKQSMNTAAASYFPYSFV